MVRATRSGIGCATEAVRVSFPGIVPFTPVVILATPPPLQ